MESTLIAALTQAQVFSRVTPEVYSQLAEHLKLCLAQSTALLTLEQQIKQHQQSLVLTLCAIFLTHNTDPQVQWVAGILLKNTLKDHLGELRTRDPGEVEAIERALFIVLATA